MLLQRPKYLLVVSDAFNLAIHPTIMYQLPLFCTLIVYANLKYRTTLDRNWSCCTNTKIISVTAVLAENVMAHFIVQIILG